LKFKLILITVLAFGSMAHAQGFLSNLSIGAGFQGVFPSTTFTKSVVENDSLGTNGTQATTNSVGYVGDARYDFGRHSALDLSVTFNRDSELFFNAGGGGSFGGFLTRVQTNNLEVIGSYIIRLPSNQHLKPYALIGGGLVHFSPNNNFTTEGIPSSEMKPAFAYGFGADLKVSDSWAVRLQYRGLIRGEPEFGLASEPFGTGLKTNVSEPSIMVVYHF
jgi:opacity protein-like surface antigen